MTKRLLPLLLILASAPAAFASIFVPINYNGPGAFGAQWHTSVIVSNRQATGFVSGTHAQFSICDGPPDSCGSPYLPAGMTSKVFSDSPHGLFINAANAGAAVFATVHIAAEPRDPDTEGTEIPIARDSDFGSSMKLVNVPTGVANGQPVRGLLRLYAPLPGGTGLPTPTGTVFVTVYDVKNPAVVAAKIEITLTQAEPDVVGYAELDLSRFASISPFVNIDVDAGQIAPVLQPVFPSSTVNVWGFVTITNNVTNTVITITPR